jgi:hypothetical protein
MRGGMDAGGGGGPAAGGGGVAAGGGGADLESAIQEYNWEIAELQQRVGGQDSAQHLTKLKRMIMERDALMKAAPHGDEPGPGRIVLEASGGAAGGAAGGEGVWDGTSPFEQDFIVGPGRLYRMDAARGGTGREMANGDFLRRMLTYNGKPVKGSLIDRHKPGLCILVTDIGKNDIDDMMAVRWLNSWPNPKMPFCIYDTHNREIAETVEIPNPPSDFSKLPQGAMVFIYILSGLNRENIKYLMHLIKDTHVNFMFIFQSPAKFSQGQPKAGQNQSEVDSGIPSNVRNGAKGDKISAAVNDYKHFIQYCQSQQHIYLTFNQYERNDRYFKAESNVPAAAEGRLTGRIIANERIPDPDGVAAAKAQVDNMSMLFSQWMSTPSKNEIIDDLMIHWGKYLDPSKAATQEKHGCFMADLITVAYTFISEHITQGTKVTF